MERDFNFPLQSGARLLTTRACVARWRRGKGRQASEEEKTMRSVSPFLRPPPPLLPPPQSLPDHPRGEVFGGGGGQGFARRTVAILRQISVIVRKKKNMERDGVESVIHRSASLTHPARRGAFPRLFLF